MTESVQDKNGQPISVGDEVYTKMRGGKHQGEVSCLTSTSLLVETPQKSLLVAHLVRLLLGNQTCICAYEAVKRLSARE